MPCGGDVTGGAWVARDAAAALAHPSGDNGCWGLTLQRNASGLHVTNVGVDYHATPRTTVVSFRPPEAAAAEGTYAVGQAFQGEVTQDFAERCLSDTQGQLSCAELASALNQIGLGEGAWSNVGCNGVTDGCSCSFQVFAAGGPSGKWSRDPGDATQLMLGRQRLDDSTAFDYFKVPYCVQGESLTFGAELAQAWPDMPPLKLERADCGDGLQGPGEVGVDCGWACPTPCPPN
jgi:hypothetical protein